MNHGDFSSLELDDVLSRVLNHCQKQVPSASVHWASAKGLERVREHGDKSWESGLASADIIGTHMWSLPATAMDATFQMWRQVDGLLIEPRQKSMAPQMISGPEPKFILPYFSGEDFLGAFVFDRPRETNPVALMAAVQPGLQVASKYMKFAYTHLEAKNLSYLDELTGLYNQRYLPMVLEHEIQRCKREKGVFSLLFLDIDFFKNVNDGRGHWVGSKLLVQLGQVLKAQVRANDYTFRYGGDEFIVLLGNSNVESSKIVAERIRQAVEGQDFVVEGHKIKLTVSIGLAGFPEHAQSAAGLIQIADQAMYYGKRKSRNIVFVAS